MPETIDVLNRPHHIRVFSGKYINLLNPDPSDIFLIDVAVGLARECRWGNHCKRFYSVAEHSIECMNQAEMYLPLDTYFAFNCLMHDAHEAYLGDIPSPLKKLIPQYDEVAERLQKAINIRFGISPRLSADVKIIDEKVLNDEWKRKNLNWTGLEMDEKSRTDLFIHHAVRLCKTPIVIMP